MNLSERLFLKTLGSVFSIFSGILFLQAIVCLLSGMLHKIDSEFIYSTYFLLVSQMLYFLGKKFESVEVDLSELPNRPYISIIVVNIVWMVFPLIGAVPFVISGESFLDAYFDSMSAFTTVGLSIKNLEEFTPSLQFWRALEQWIGGIGIITIAIILLSKSWVFRRVMEIGGAEEIGPFDLKDFMRDVFLIYTIITVIGAFMYNISGYSLFKSLLLSMASISTGGMIPKVIFNPLQKLITTTLMFLGMVGPIPLVRAIKGRKVNIKPLLFLIFWISFVSLTISIVEDISLIDSLFHTVSASSTTGIYTIEISKFSHLTIFLLMVSIFVGGLEGSTSGGIKVERLMHILRGIRDAIKRIMGYDIEEDPEVYISFAILFCYIGMVFLGTLFFLTIINNTIYAQFSSVSISLSGFSPIPVEDFTALMKVFSIMFFFAGRVNVVVAISFIPSLYKLLKR